MTTLKKVTVEFYVDERFGYSKVENQVRDALDENLLHAVTWDESGIDGYTVIGSDLEGR